EGPPPPNPHPPAIPAPGALAGGALAAGAPHPPGPVPSPPVGERSPSPEGGRGAVHTPRARPPGAPPAPLEGYLPLRRPARRVRRALWVSLLLALVSGAVNLGDIRMV